MSLLGIAVVCVVYVNTDFGKKRFTPMLSWTGKGKVARWPLVYFRGEQ